MKKILIGIAAIASITFSSCSIFIRTKHHSAGGSIGTTTPVQDSTKAAGGAGSTAK